MAGPNREITTQTLRVLLRSHAFYSRELCTIYTMDSGRIQGLTGVGIQNHGEIN